MEHSGLIAPNSTFSFTISSQALNKRLDHYISQQFPLYSRSFFQRVIDDGFVSINNKPATKASIALKVHDIVTVQFPPQRSASPQALTEQHRGIEIVAQTDHFLILFKPAGLMVHSPAARSTLPTLVDWLLANYAEIGSVGAIDRPGIVHRLDKDTSGIMIIPRTNYAHTVFGTMFNERTIKKTYLAVVHGHPPRTGLIEYPIGRDPRNPTRMTTFPHTATSSTIRPSSTHYTVLEYFQDHSLVEVRPVTGRTHQIRVHFAAIGYPLMGDPTYGRASRLIQRHALHAQKLSFQFDQTNYDYIQDAPADFQDLLKVLRAKTAD